MVNHALEQIDTSPAVITAPVKANHVISIDDLQSVAQAALVGGPSVSIDFTGDKFDGGFGVTKCFEPDYWTLRERSKQLFRENIYARGIVRRYVTNIVTTGLELEARPEEGILGYEEGALDDWSEATENRYHLWASNAWLCDFYNQQTMGKLHATIKREALICGDVLLVIRYNPVTKLPMLQVIPGDRVQTSSIGAATNKDIVEGVERDGDGRHIAFHIMQDDGSTKRLPAYDSRTGRRIAWLYYGTDKMHSDVRGESLLSILLQSLKEIDRYRDSAQRKALVNSLIAMFIKRSVEGPKSLPMQGGAVRNEKSAVTDSDGSQRQYQISYNRTGSVIQGLEPGEEPVQLGGGGTDVNFGPFEEAIISAIAWSCECPPEILKLAFSNNYSASQAAINEFKMFLNKERKDMGDDVCAPVYREWMISEAINGTLRSPGFLDVWRDKTRFYEFAAWTNSDWSGAIKPSTDVYKMAKGYEIMENKGWITNARIARELTGTKYSKNIKQLRRERSDRAVVDKIGEGGAE